MQEMRLLVRDLIKHSQHSFVSPLLAYTCQENSICWLLSDQVRIVLLFHTFTV